MDCRTSKDMIQCELDGTLECDEARELASHLETCAECSRIRNELLAIDDALSNVPIEIAPHRVTESILAEVSRRKAAHQLAEPLAIGAAVLAGAGLTVFGALKATSAGAGGGLWAWLVQGKNIAVEKLGWVTERAPEIAPGGDAGVFMDVAVWAAVAALLALVIIGGRRLSRELREDLS